MASNGVFGMDGLRLRFVGVFGFSTVVVPLVTLLAPIVVPLVVFFVAFFRVPLSGIMHTLSQFFKLQHMVNTGVDTN